MCIETRSPSRRLNTGRVSCAANPAETAARRGRKRRAKTDNADCDLQLRLAGELPESWMPPAQILELRTLVRLGKTLIDQRTAWQKRIQAQLFHRGVPGGLRLRTEVVTSETTSGSNKKRMYGGGGGRYGADLRATRLA
jgi:hypothetical protein